MSTGIDRLDGLLQGGIAKGSLVEILTFSHSGSEIWCYHLVNIASMQGMKTLWITSNGSQSFQPLTIRRIARRYGLDPDKVIANISVMELHGITQLMDNFDRLVDECSDDYGLIIVNPLTPLFLHDIFLTIKIPEEERGLQSRDHARPIIEEGQETFSQFIEKIRQLVRDTGVICVTIRWAYPSSSKRTKTDKGHPWDLCFRMTSPGSRQRRIELVSEPDTPMVEVFQGYGGFYPTSNRMEADDREFLGEWKEKMTGRATKQHLEGGLV